MGLICHERCYQLWETMFFVQIIDLNGFVHKKQGIPILEEASGNNPCSSFLSQGMIYDVKDMGRPGSVQGQVATFFNTVPYVTDCWTVDETCVKISASRSRVSCFRFFPCSTLPLGPSMQRSTMWIHNFQTSSQPLGDMLFGSSQNRSGKELHCSRTCPWYWKSKPTRNHIKTYSGHTQTIKKKHIEVILREKFFLKRTSYSVLPQSDLKDLCTPQSMLSRWSADAQLMLYVCSANA